MSQFRQKCFSAKLMKQHMLEISQLYNKANTISGRAFRRKLSKIDRKVIRWNEQSNRQDYYDLHGMSKLGAQRYVESIVAGKTGKFRFETGRGLHSTNNVAKIKNALLEEYQERPRCSIRVDSLNYGVLVLEKW
ncbi:hypothetical protein GCK72_000473 [Caenorhabditis remanei]|uniref:Smr domain-containing protein n=1 Tax=Caenorhabditis remanei TaxID=31234 RepID=A0A6A5HKF7_CAERE|nr:hypothetical protein GCK72_000473 [Caenorhabditis remanei]KAF1768660.1 hypothetical protein GCK72_000473 [Caenorhabditis remanei]